MADTRQKPTTVDEYIAGFPPDVRTVLEDIRAAIRQVAPEAVEKIGYQIAAFEVDGAYLVYLGGWRKHVAIYPLPKGPSSLLAKMEPYRAGQGTVRFPLARPVPLGLVREIVRSLLRERRAAKAARAARRRPASSPEG